MPNWYYLEFGQLKGPISEHSLIEKVLRGEMELDTSIMKQNTTKMVKFNEVDELMHKYNAPVMDMKFDAKADRELGKFVGKDEEIPGIYPQEAVFFYIPISRLILMTVITVGLYQLYWFYKNWSYARFQNARESAYASRHYSTRLSLIRTFVSMEQDKQLNEVERCPFSGRLYAFLFIFTLVFDLSILISLPIQLYLNRVNDRLRREYSPKTFGHYLCLILGLVGWVIIYFL
ncbi:MAG TPA: hypothetical protein PLE74_12170 [Candidatus Cloacimonadota bacterium]|nr:hypothetical protein [Candidatus Cloacimonadota bacterium]HPT73022.1 hypothetical protein [Candidatus Cloacimonadota bacterium]